MRRLLPLSVAFVLAHLLFIGASIAVIVLN